MTKCESKNEDFKQLSIALKNNPLALLYPHLSLAAPQPQAFIKSKECEDMLQGHW